MDGHVGDFGQNGGEIFAHRNPELAAAFDHRQDRGDARSGLRAAVYLFTIVSIMIQSETKLLSMMRLGSGVMATPCSSHCLQARFSRWMTSTKYSAGLTLRTSLSS